MMTFSRIFLFAAVTVALAACGGLDLGKAKSVAPKGKAFDQHLYAEYLAMSQEEYDESDFGNSDIFAQRAIAAGSGKSPAPEEISARKLPADKVGDLTAARARLVAALTKGAEAKPQPAARAQAMFDCWMEEQEENIQPDDIAACRAEFDKAMAQLEAAPMAAPMAAKPAAPAPMPMAMPGPFMLYFDFDSAKLTAAAEKVVKDAAAAIAKAKPETVVVIGYTDRAGTEKYNMALSRKRADAAAAALKAAGVTTPTKTIIASYGEMDPLVPTADGQREAKNRRVSITLK